MSETQAQKDKKNNNRVRAKERNYYKKKPKLINEEQRKLF